MSVRNHRVSVFAATLGLLFSLFTVLAAPASAHVERPSYWPDPKPDCSIRPCAGGEVPTIKTLKSALRRRPVTKRHKKHVTTRVVCQPDSLKRVKRSIAQARRTGYSIRPTDHRTFSRREARQLRRINTRLFRMCRYHEIQPAVTASGNNSRVVVMPGLYTEPTARAKPTGDPACSAYRIKADSGDPGALSHDYQLHCPNDANLVAVIGRGPDTAALPASPREDRHGIPNPGPCIRCNLQLEGSGVSADDVIVEAGDPAAGNGGPSAVGHAKHVGIFVDRADGFVLRNMTVRHAREHDIYVMETDGYVLDRFKTYYAGGYGVLTFVEDHGVMQNCEAAGNGDSGLYPGSGADSTDKRYTPFYPEYRYSQVVRWCDSHHNTGGFSGTDSHGTLITENNFYDNALGLTTDVFTAPGHPGFPQHGNVIEKNNFFSNNFNPYVASSDVAPFIPAPVGTGLWLAGGNANTVRNNHFFDNWRRGTMLFAVPDATVCGPTGSGTPVPGCNPAGITTSFDNSQYGNVMGVDPSGHTRPNGLDFWWDSFVGNTGNCWWGNAGAPGRALTSTPASLPNCANGTQPSQSIGLGNPTAEAELVGCLAGLEVSGTPSSDSTACSWTTTPTPPSGGSGGGSGGPTLCSLGVTLFGCQPLLGASAPSSSSFSASSTESEAPRQSPLGDFTCSWWRKAGTDERSAVVDRIRNFATGRVDGTQAVGYGHGLTDDQAAALFEDRCSWAQSGPFALYKLYGAAAAFSATH